MSDKAKDILALIVSVVARALIRVIAVGVTAWAVITSMIRHFPEHYRMIDHAILLKFIEGLESAGETRKNS